MESFENAGIIREIEQWRSQKEVYEKLFSVASVASPSHSIAQIRKLMEIAARYQGVQNELALGLLRTERRLLERKAFPSLAARLLFRISSAFFQLKLNRNVKAVLETNATMIENSLKVAGLPGIAGRIREGMKGGQGRINADLAFQVKGDARMSISIDAARKEGGVYDLVYTAKLNRNGKDTVSVRFDGEISKHFTVARSEALLNGKAVRMPNGEWMQLDFTDRDKNGNFMIKRYPQTYGYNLAHELDKLPLKDEPDQGMRNAMMRRLERGENVTVLLGVGSEEKVVTVFASPGNMTLELKDLSGKRVELDSKTERTSNKQHIARYRREKTSRKWIKQ